MEENVDIVLRPYERRNEYYFAIDLGKNVEQQKSLMRDQTKVLVATLISSTNAIIASQEKISESINNLLYSVDDISDGTNNLYYSIDDISGGIEGLRAAFEWGISEVVWQIEQNREVLKNILEILMAPLDTKAKELKHRAEEAYSNGWHADALEDFLESEKINRYDFSVHISLGMIYLFHKKNKKKALEYFKKALKYAKPKSKYHASLALLYLGLILWDSRNIEVAEKCRRHCGIGRNDS